MPRQEGPCSNCCHCISLSIVLPSAREMSSVQPAPPWQGGFSTQGAVCQGCCAWCSAHGILSALWWPRCWWNHLQHTLQPYPLLLSCHSAHCSPQALISDPRFGQPDNCSCNSHLFAVGLQRGSQPPIVEMLALRTLKQSWLWKKSSLAPIWNTW